jgi:hypothetical protein
MRSTLCMASLMVLLTALGCNLAPHARDLGGSNAGGIAKDKPAATPTVENLVAYLNNNARRIQPGQALNCKNVTIDVVADAGRVGISAMMQCQAPRNFLMSGVTLGNPVVDIGSNYKEFWFWSKQINPPYLYHVSYDAMAQGVKVPFPFQPEMALSAMGLAPYDPAKKYDMMIVKDKRGNPAFIELTEQARSPENKPVLKVTRFNYTQAQRPDEPQVLAHILKDERGNIICAATIRSVQQVGESGLIVPKIVDFNWPEQKMKMAMTIYNPELIAMPPEKAAMRFTRQNLRYQPYDLAGPAQSSAGVQQTGATGTIYRR